MVEKTKDKEDKPEEDTYHCAQCKAAIVKGQAFCPGCGQKLDWSGIG